MSRARQDQVMALLIRDAAWRTAGELADVVGVTPRSIRSYVAALNARVPGGDAIESGASGYRAGAGAAGALRTVTEETPRDRLHRLVRDLLDAPAGIDVYAAAQHFHVSEATLESDLGRVRALLSGTQLTLERSAERVRLSGTEMAQRRLLSRLVHDEMEQGAFDLRALRRALGESTAETSALGAFKAELVDGLGELGYLVNEFGIGDVMMHIAIAADRVGRGRGLDGAPVGDSAARSRIADLLDHLAVTHLGIHLGDGDRDHLAALVQTRVVAPGPPSPTPSSGIDWMPTSKRPCARSSRGRHPSSSSTSTTMTSSCGCRCTSRTCASAPRTERGRGTRSPGRSSRATR